MMEVEEIVVSREVVQAAQWHLPDRDADARCDCTACAESEIHSATAEKYTDLTIQCNRVDSCTSKKRRREPQQIMRSSHKEFQR
jgi:hypothetical protein